MSGATLDPASSERLRTVRNPVELFDQLGRPLGTLIPFAQKELDRCAEMPCTHEEIRHLKRQNGGRTLAEILADLEDRS